MKKTITWAIILFVSLVGGVIGKDLVKKITEKPSADTVGAEIVKAINKTMPMQVDKDIRMDTAAYFNKTIKYSYTLIDFIKDKKNNYSNKFKDHEGVVRNKFCTNPELKVTKDMGISNQYVYYDKNGEFVYGFTVSPLECADVNVNKEDEKVADPNEWKEGKEVLVDKRNQVLSACNEGVKGQGYSNKQAVAFCKCSVDYFTETANKYSKDELLKIGKERGDMNFIRTDSQVKCKHFIGE